MRVFKCLFGKSVKRLNGIISSILILDVPFDVSILHSSRINLNIFNKSKFIITRVADIKDLAHLSAKSSVLSGLSQ